MNFTKGILVASWILVCLGAIFYIGRVNGHTTHNCPKVKFDFKKVPNAFGKMERK